MGQPTKTRRRIFVGDLQGCREELEQLLDAVKFDTSADELHPVGDFVNRGPDSLGVLRLCRELDAGGVLGNHDLHLFACARGDREPKGRDTFQDVLASRDRDELLEWLRARPFLRVWDDMYLVHAGLSPRWADPASALQNSTADAPGEAGACAVSLRTCNSGGESGGPDAEGSTPPYRPWFAWYEPDEHAGRRVVFGHWSLRGLVHEPKVTGLDTGCVWGRELTAWIPEEQRIISVPAARCYSPIES